MPLYEFLRLAIEKLEASQQNKCSVDLSSEVTENGKITTQKQPDTPSVCDEAALGNSVTGRIDKCGGVEYIINGISPELPSDVLDLSQKDETVPWLSYHVDGSVQDYSSSVSAKKLLARNSVMPLQNGGSYDQSAGDLDAVKLSSMKAHPLHPWMRHKEDFCILCNGEGNCKDTTFENSGNLVTDSSTMKMESLHKTLLVNSRQVLAKEPREMFVDGRSKKMMALENKASHSTRAALDAERTVESIAAAASSSSVSSGNSAGERVSDERKHNTKRKFRNTEEFECQSDKLQKECAGMKKSSPAQGGRGSKRSRAAEVHNLSERRRRDRINEKMRALQQLIPNCNKADKASVLDEAIEYLKKLKHQVQMMSIGSGLCVPALMFPPGNRHMHDAYAPVPVPHLSYMGMRMGMGMSSGLENTSPVFPILPMPGHPIAGAHLVPLKGWHQTSAFKQE